MQTLSYLSWGRACAERKEEGIRSWLQGWLCTCGEFSDGQAFNPHLLRPIWLGIVISTARNTKMNKTWSLSLRISQAGGQDKQIRTYEQHKEICFEIEWYGMYS